ncbi:MAG TPA: hypothetical protein VIL99_02515 [Ignavibacteria bacterium]|jgi:hypothetical protein
MKEKLNSQFKFYLTVLIAAGFLLGCGKITSLFKGDKLYFCEKYDPVKGEIGESDKFTTGYLTVMVKLSKPIGVTDVDINVTDIKKNEVVNTQPFTVTSEMTYIYFDKVTFDKTGKYKVSLLKKDGTVIVTGEIEIIEK